MDTSDLVFPFIDDISGTIRGYRIFTACRTVNGKIFRLEDHLNRLYYSAESLYMVPPVSRTRLKELLDEVIRVNSSNDFDGDLLIDVIFSGGLLGSTMKQSGEGAHLYIVVQEMVPPTKESYEKGVSLATFVHQRIYPDVKLLNYVGAVIAHQTVVPAHSAFEVLFLDPMDGSTILEGSTFTVFFVKRTGEIVTPPLDGRVLDSVTRRALMEVLQAEGSMPLKEEYLKMEELDTVSECFLVSTTRNVLPVVRIDDKSVGRGVPGPVTKFVTECFERYVAGYNCSAS